MKLKITIDKAISLLKNNGECERQCTECPVVFIYTIDRVKECTCPIERMFIAEKFIKNEVKNLMDKNIKTKLSPEYIEYKESNKGDVQK